MKIIYRLLVFVLLFACNEKNKQDRPLQYPKISSVSQIDDYWGKNIVDLYRNLERKDDTINDNWLKAQSLFANDILNKINGKPSLIEKMKDLQNRSAYSINSIRLSDNENYFYLKKKTDEDYFKLYYRELFSEKEELLFDPKSFRPETKNDYRINYIQPSWNGEYVAIAMSYDGKELSEMIIFDVKNHKVLPEVISNCWPSSFLGINWLPDNSGFTYLHFPVTNPKDSNFKKNTKSVLYRIGQRTDELNVIFTGSVGNKKIPDVGNYPSTKINSSSDKYIIGYITGVDSYWNAYYTEIEKLKTNTHKWKPLFLEEDKIYSASGFFYKDEFIYKSAKNASNYAIKSTKITQLDFKNPKILVKERKDESINEFTITKDGLFYTTLKYGVEAKLYKNFNGLDNEISLPKKSGNIYLRSLGGNSSNMWIYINGWANDMERYKYEHSTNVFLREEISISGLYPEFDNLEVQEVLVSSHDGELVPLSIVYDKDRVLIDGNNPLLIDGYGAYGDSMTPYFSPIILSWVKEGGIFCTAHVRGGGEKGEKWRLDGFKNTKPNTWKDLIACVEYLIEKDYTSDKKIVVLGESAGAIMAGNALMERPDLFAAGIIQVGLTNPLRLESVPGGGGSNYKEFGTVKDSIEAIGLINMDPYLKIKNNINYPAMLLTAGINDIRIPAWMPGKFVARLQNSDTKNPVLFDVNYDSGHTQDGSNDEVYEEWSNIFSFAFWQTGHPDYQLKE